MQNFLLYFLLEKTLLRPAPNLTCIFILDSFLFGKSSESPGIVDVFAFLLKISRLSLSLSLYFFLPLYLYY
jgi:hypothetical protein